MELERKRHGGAAAFQRSLQLLADEVGNERERELHTTEPVKEPVKQPEDRVVFVIDLRRYRKLSLQEQRRDLAGRLLAIGVRDFSMGQIQEILKRIVPPASAKSLQRPTKPRAFRVLCLAWKFNAEQILVSRV